MRFGIFLKFVHKWDQDPPPPPLLLLSFDISSSIGFYDQITMGSLTSLTPV